MLKGVVLCLLGIQKPVGGGRWGTAGAKHRAGKRGKSVGHYVSAKRCF